jgi:hypothetical protein
MQRGIRHRELGGASPLPLTVLIGANGRVSAGSMGHSSGMVPMRFG